MTTVYVPGAVAENVQEPVALPATVKVTEAHVAVRPVAGVIAVANVTVPKKPHVVVQVVRVPVPPRLASDRLLVPVLPVMMAAGVVALKLKSLISAVSVGPA